ncbi:MAG TPA: DUF885 domain-containing protein [Chitinophagaceae bacterium]|nr:DUF885 domain-containing protein [Chitinophagaceae bacterium]
MKKILPVLFCAFVGLNACQSTQTENAPSAEGHKACAQLMAAYWEERLQLFPLEATAYGDNRYNDRLPVTISDSYRARVADFYQRYLNQINALKEVLSPEDQQSIDLLRYDLQLGLDGLQFPSNQIPITQFWSFTLEFPQLGSGSGNQPFKSVQDYNHFLSRMHAFPQWVDTAILNMKKGIQNGYTLPRPLAEKVLPQLQQVIAADVTNSIFYGPIAHFPDSISEESRKELTAAYREAIAQDINASYQKLVDFFKKEYIPACRTTHGISSLPDGKAYYQYLIRLYTTTDLSADSIYHLGLKEVDSLTMEMNKIRGQVGFQGDLPAFFSFMNRDRRFYPFHTAKEVLDSFWSVKNTIGPNLKKLFENEPKTRFEIRQTEAFRAASASAEYNPGSEDGSRPGIFYVPVLHPDSFNAIGMETLFLHEAIPGHHYQISLQQENTNLPSFRKFIGYSAYQEGWALYTETLGKELGIYKDPYQYFGHLSDAMHRAIRLVVDVAIHAKGMRREEAIAYMKAHERVSDAEAVSEIERYMAIPGQALSYKIGQITISRLKAQCKQHMGDRFSDAAFHTEVLKGGTLPLELLEKNILSWTKTAKLQGDK